MGERGVGAFRSSLRSSLQVGHPPLLRNVNPPIRRIDVIRSRGSFQLLSFTKLGERGVEPPPLSGQAPKACASASSATRPNLLEVLHNRQDAPACFSTRPSPTARGKKFRGAPQDEPVAQALPHLGIFDCRFWIVDWKTVVQSKIDDRQSTISSALLIESSSSFDLLRTFKETALGFSIVDFGFSIGRRPFNQKSTIVN